MNAESIREQGAAAKVEEAAAFAGKGKKSKSASPRPSDALITQGLVRLCAERHDGASLGSSREWAVFRELRNSAGHGRSESYVDFFALNLWPSKKFWRVAYELKASRADFLRELKKPEKRSWGMEVSNEFWYVCYPGVAKPEEIPEGCGLMVANDELTKLRKVVQAPQRDCRDFSMTEVASLARRQTEAFAPLFSYAGKDLGEADLHKLLESRMDGHLRSLVRQDVEEQVQESLTSASHVLTRYAKDMREAGLEPPAWMEQPNLARHIPWDATRWVQNTLSKKLGRATLTLHRQALERAISRTKQLQESLEEAQQQTDELLSPPASTSPTEPVHVLT